MSRYFEFQDAASHKFWEIEYNDDSVTIKFGKVGTLGKISEKNLMGLVQYSST